MDLYTKIRNTSDEAVFCSYLGISGRTLAAGQEVSVLGSPIDLLREGAFSFGQAISQRKTALEADIAAERITVISTPTVVLKDAGSGTSFEISSDSDALALEQVHPTTTSA